ncbi:MAG: hypothetical protein HOI47_19105 [Candidatus Scalindua sp.]|jgi:hypothetical protein|nr:hypothetical protein [Candidatus Scalindua sp.]
MNSYRDMITAKIRDAVNQWLDKLKKEKPELQLTRQWKVQFDNGFIPGHASLPVITGSKKGKHLIAEVGFIVPDNLEIDLDDLELSLLDEPFKQKKQQVVQPTIGEPLGVLNDIIVGVNNFLSELSFTSIPGQAVKRVNLTPSPQMINRLKVNTGTHNQQDIGDVRKQIRSSNMLPEWLRSISNREVFDTLVDKIAEGYVQYSKTSKVTLPEFFKLYEDYLKKEGKLFDYCKYKAQPIELDENNGHCLEGYCSKKGFNKVCDQSIKKFGKK